MSAQQSGSAPASFAPIPSGMVASNVLNQFRATIEGVDVHNKTGEVKSVRMGVEEKLPEQAGGECKQVGEVDQVSL